MIGRVYGRAERKEEKKRQRQRKRKKEEKHLPNSFQRTELQREKERK